MENEVLSGENAGKTERKNISWRYFRPSIERLRIILMFLMCVDLFGFPTAFGEFFQTICGFVPIAFFILSGYLVLRNSKNRSQRIARAIKRSAAVFGVLAVVYFVINLFYYRQQGVNILSAFASKRFWFNLVVLNLWQFDIGSAIWYVQALLYAYIIIYFLDKWKLLKFDWLIAAVLLAAAILTGEFSGVFKWNIAGYTYIPGNFFTRALPYILLGAFIHRKMDLFGRVHQLWYWLAIVGGVFLIFMETIVLSKYGMEGYYGHLIGYGVIAVAVCVLTFLDYYSEPGFEAVLDMSRWHINGIYYLCQPVSFGIVLLFSLLGDDALINFVDYIGLITFVVCFGLMWFAAYMGRTVFAQKVK